jgi:hypothetical protein
MAHALNVGRVIVASDFGPKFLNFWPIVAQSWSEVFGISPELALVFDESEGRRVASSLVKLEKYGRVHAFQAAKKAPIGNQAKLARFFVAGQTPQQYSMVDDIDTIHVRAEYLCGKFSGVDRNRLTGLGSEVYKGTPHERNFPAGNFSGPGHLFNALFNPQELAFTDFIESFQVKPTYSRRENPFNKPGKFSDEYLISALLDTRNLRGSLDILSRDQDIYKEWLDRSWWAPQVEIEARRSDFEVINFLRPLFENREAIEKALKVLVPGVEIEIMIEERLKISALRRLLTRWVAI